MFEPKGARRYNSLVTLTKSGATVDDFGHPSFGNPVEVGKTYACIRQMSATKTMLTFQQADIIGLDIEMRSPSIEFDGLIWNSHDVHFSAPEKIGNRERFIKIPGWYQKDNPNQL